MLVKEENTAVAVVEKEKSTEVSKEGSILVEVLEALGVREDSKGSPQEDNEDVGAVWAVELPSAFRRKVPKLLKRIMTSRRSK